MRRPSLLAVLLVLTTSAHAQRASPVEALDGLAKPHGGRARRQGSTDPSGRNGDLRTLGPGETATLFTADGAGVIRRFFYAFLPRSGVLGDPSQVVGGGGAADVVAAHRQVVLRMYWDGEDSPSVESPVGDFFGVGFGVDVDFVSVPMSRTTGGNVSYWPMPFHRSARITISNLSPATIVTYWYNIDYTTYRQLPTGLRHFHAQWRRENPTTAGRPYAILEARGRGHYVGTALFAQLRRRNAIPLLNFVYLEGDEQISIDGESTPSIVGTGHEEYFNGGFYFDRGPVVGPYHGVVVKDDTHARTSTYRWHIPDPIPFSRSLRVAIEHGTENAADADYSSVAYWYQDEPHLRGRGLPDDPRALLPSVSCRSVMSTPALDEETRRTGAGSWVAVVAAGVVATLVALAVCFAVPHPATLRLDNKLVLFPMTLEAFRRYGLGQIAHWSNGLWGGYPLLADPDTEAFYPPTLLAFLLTPEPHLRAYDVASALHLGLLVAGVVRLLQALGTRTPSCLLGGVLVFLGPQVHWWTFGFLQCLAALAWWPWTLLAAERLSHERRMIGPAVVAGSLALAAQVLAGYPEFAVHSAALLAAWLTFRRTDVPWRQRALRALVVVTLGLLAAGVQLFPTALALQDSRRGGALPLTERALSAVRFEGARTFLAPTTAETTPPTLLGFATCVAAAIAYAIGRGKAPTRMLGGIAAVTVVLSLGQATPLFAVATSVPPFNLFRLPFKFLTAADLVLVLSAALGIDALAAIGRRRRTIAVLAAILATVAVAERLAYARMRLPGYLREGWREAPLATLLDGLRRQATAVAGVTTRPPPRVLVRGAPWLYGNLGMVLGLESLGGGTVSLPDRRHVAALDVPVLTRSFLDLLGVGLVQHSRAVCPPEPLLPRVGGAGSACLLRNVSGDSRYTLEKAQAVTSVDEMMRLIHTDPGGPVPMMLEPEDSPLSTEEVQGSVGVLSYQPGTILLAVEAKTDAVLLVRESWKRGWHAQVDARDAVIRPAAALFLGVRIPAGRHRVDLRYRTPGLAVGMAASGAWLLVAIAWCTRRR